MAPRDAERLELTNERLVIRRGLRELFGGSTIRNTCLGSKVVHDMQVPLDVLKKNGMKTFSMVSNGYFATKDVLTTLTCHGLNRFQVSLDGANNESCFVLRQNKNAYDKAVTAIKNAKEVGLKDISVAFCPTKYNMGELEDVIRQCIELGVANLRIQPLMTIGRVSQNVERIRPSQGQYVEFIQNIRDYQKQYFSEINIEWGDPLHHIFRYKDLMKDQNIFVSIRSDGSICPSLYLPISVGNVKHHNSANIGSTASAGHGPYQSSGI